MCLIFTRPLVDIMQTSWLEIQSTNFCIENATLLETRAMYLQRTREDTIIDFSSYMHLRQLD